MEMKTGSCLFMLSTLFHHGGANHTNEPRPSLTVQYCQPWCRPIENMMINLTPGQLDAMPDRLVEMLGFKVAFPFIGQVDGAEPRQRHRRFARRAAEELQQGKARL